MATFTNKAKSSAPTVTNRTKTSGATSAQVLNIGGGYQLLIGGTYNLQIQGASSGTVWSNKTKS